MNHSSTMLDRLLPCRLWLRDYQRSTLAQDLSAAAVVTVMLIPQSLAYALIAGVPAEVGLYASILPLIAYALFGTSRTLSVGPVAVISLMTATSLGEVAQSGTASYLTAASTLALLSGLLLLLMGFLRMGVIANFLSHAVISGFISASGILIALGQCKHLLGIEASGDTLSAILPSLLASIDKANAYSLGLGVLVLLFLLAARRRAQAWLQAAGLAEHTAALLSKAAPMFAVILSILAAYLLNLGERGVALVGDIPAGLPAFSLSWPSRELLEQLTMPALLISIIGYVESVSVGKTLAARRRQRVDANQELIGLGAANLASSVSGAFPVTGGFSRSVVNYDAGAATQASSVFTAAGIAIACLFFAPLLYFLPKATLAATIIVAVLSLVDFDILRKTWRISKSDFAAVLITILATLAAGVESGVAWGIGTSLALHLLRTSRPHFAEVGLVEGTEHFRNILRFTVQTRPDILSIRLDESLFFANASYLEDIINEHVYKRDSIAHVVLMCSAVNEVDFSALETLENINHGLLEQGIHFHLSEVKGPVHDRLVLSGFLEELSGQVFLTQYEAYQCLCKTTGKYS